MGEFIIFIKCLRTSYNSFHFKSNLVSVIATAQLINGMFLYDASATKYASLATM